MSEAITKALEDFNRYFTSANSVDVPARVSVPRDEWRSLFAALSQAGQGEAYTIIDMGFGKWEVGAGTNAGVPCIAFGVHGSGKVGELITIGPRQMSVEETHAVITFANYEGFAVLQEKMDEVRALHFSATQPAPVPSRYGSPELQAMIVEHATKPAKRCDYPGCTKACGDAKGFCHKGALLSAAPKPAKQEGAAP